MEDHERGVIFGTSIALDGINELFEKDVNVREVINDSRRRVLEISIIAGAVLKRHKAAEPITALCINGRGQFYAGAELEEQVEISRGSLVALDRNVDHEVTAESDLRILVTQFK
jgi:quercetin dioxygenase-like cupin family protein